MNRYMTFTVNGLELGIDMAAVVAMEKNDFQPFETMVTGPDIYFYNGEPIPLWRISSLFDRDGQPPEGKGDSKILVIRSNNGLLGLSVDGACSIVKANEVRILSLPPVFGSKAMKFCPHVLHAQGVLLPLINPDEIEGIALGHLGEIIKEEERIDDFSAPLRNRELLSEVENELVDGIDFPETDIVTPERLKAGITRVVEKKIKQRLSQLISKSFETLGAQNDLPDWGGEWTK